MRSGDALLVDVSWPSCRQGALRPLFYASMTENPSTARLTRRSAASANRPSRKNETGGRATYHRRHARGRKNGRLTADREASLRLDRIEILLLPMAEGCWHGRERWR